ncbi:class I SAM-dependent methyltransferase [Methanolobus sp. ZRKC3]|uniref:class I SAM-dependent methyltransferase n=1 Tax=Methanolobus sp. ZRKC3 TaxID=3125786 RepID=UPI0032511716
MSESAIFEIYDGLPRQGPGDNQSTERAFKVLPELPANASILDIGCGVGMQTRQLAKMCEDCRITAVDIYQPYLDTLMKNATEDGSSEKITTLCGSMDDLPLEEQSFDLIWAEGSIFVMGFQKGLEYWKKFLKDGGFMAITEAAWFTDKPSEEVFRFWEGCYPDIKTIEENEKVIETAGYTVIDRFKLPDSAWWDDYYIPMQERLDRIEDRFKENEEAKSIIEFSRTEIEVFRKHSDEYGYVFFIMKKNQ